MSDRQSTPFYFTETVGVANLNVFLIDGTYELFRHFYAVPSVSDTAGHEVGAVRGVVGSLLSMLEEGVTHMGVATDHSVESFRNKLWPGYKTGEGIDPLLLQQFQPVEEALSALGVVVWRMVEWEADDALASAAAKAYEDDRVEQVFICTPDKDLAQCVRDRRVVQFDRRAGVMYDSEGIRTRFGIKPESIIDYLALVGDSADGYPGLPGWGRKSASTLLARYIHVEAIPKNVADWDVNVRGAEKLSRVLEAHRQDAALFRDLATLRTDVPVMESLDELRWEGPKTNFFDTCTRLNAPGYYKRVQALMDVRIRNQS